MDAADFINTLEKLNKYHEEEILKTKRKAMIWCKTSVRESINSWNEENPEKKVPFGFYMQMMRNMTKEIPYDSGLMDIIKEALQGEI